MVALMAAALSMGCGDDASPEAMGTDTDVVDSDDPDSSSAGPSGTSGDATTGQADETGEEDDTGSDTTGEDVEDSPYRVVFSNSPDGTARLYSASLDFAQVDSLTLPGAHGISKETAPQMHSKGRYVAYARADSVYTADVWTGAVEKRSTSSSPAVTLQWSPVEPVLAWISQSALLWTGAVGDPEELLFDLGSDASQPDSIRVSWGPLGDRLMIYSRPNGAQYNAISVIDSDGTNFGLVCGSATSHCARGRWAPGGEEIIFRGDVSDDHPGQEVALGEREGFEVISEASGNVEAFAVSEDRTRVVYRAGASIYSVNFDGTGSTLIAPAPEFLGLLINDTGTWAAWQSDSELTVSPTTLYASVTLVEDGVDLRTGQFEPGGARLAYRGQADADAVMTLWLVDGNGAAEVSHALEEGQFVDHYTWAGDGLRYSVKALGEARHVGIFHTQSGATPSFVPEPDELQLSWVESGDGKLLVVRTEREDGTGRLCTFEVSNAAALSEIGCHAISGTNDFMAVSELE
jgi:hypothetical protein